MQEIEDFDAEAQVRMRWITYKGKEILLDDYSNIMPHQFPPFECKSFTHHRRS